MYVLFVNADSNLVLLLLIANACSNCGMYIGFADKEEPIFPSVLERQEARSLCRSDSILGLSSSG